VADGAAVDSLVYQFAVTRESWVGERTRVIYRSAPFAVPPVVTSPHVRPQLRAELQSILLAMADDRAAQRALRALDIDRFVTIEDGAYDAVRDVQAQAGVWEPQ
jgi:phosphonate transport system substrate-binding protein